MMLSTEHIRVYRRGETLRPLYLEDNTSLAKTLIAVYRDHLGRRRGALTEALSDCEELGYDYRLVRGLASVLDSRSVYRVGAAVPPLKARSEVFKAAGAKVVTAEGDRLDVLQEVARRLGVTAEELDASLYADLDDEQVLAEFRAPTPEELDRYYNYAHTVALLAYSRSVTLTTPRRDEYLEVLAVSLGEASTSGDKRSTSITVSMNPTSRVSARGSKVDELLGRTLKAGEWTLEAVIHYPSTNRRPGILNLSSDAHGGLLERDPEEEEMVIELAPRQFKKPSLGEIIVLEELASRRGVTESKLLNEIKEEGTRYRDLGGVLVTPGKLEELREALVKTETLGAAHAVLREHGVRDFMPVLEALGYAVEWRRPRDESRVYRL
jgi:predicted nuclease of restriction endonuclease-like RecB superfamily